MKTLPMAILVTLTAYAGFASLAIATRITPFAYVLGAAAVPVVQVLHLMH
ncbi:hypothetical protein SAMN05216466_106223 [Paraburkholderia phenazinium]|uniref:Uncharacterized protein n=1 Tax=Paraburkholderia phenazinium TaxID=60549 RepID=A0A1G7YK02_9BURK|nr:hypothetical protein [Paraburkholderia phenazinium]SDG96868.1 hypothetical protein SAMN05216466_106223 [Paraburkholderia phenazinium]